MENEFLRTPRNQIKRAPGRGQYDRPAVYRVLDQAWICHVGIANWRGADEEEIATGPTVIPMFHARVGNEVLFHGATSSRLMQALCGGGPICMSAAMVDGLVLAKSLFHHSMNYRSVVAFGTGREILERGEKLEALKALTDKVMPGRWDDARRPSEQEMKATAIVAVDIESASAKIRSGGPNDAPEDLALPVWSGAIPFCHSARAPVSCSEQGDPREKGTRSTQMPRESTVPGYIQSFVKLYNQ